MIKFPLLLLQLRDLQYHKVLFSERILSVSNCSCLNGSITCCVYSNTYIYFFNVLFVLFCSSSAQSSVLVPQRELGDRKSVV